MLFGIITCLLHECLGKMKICFPRKMPSGKIFFFGGGEGADKSS